MNGKIQNSPIRPPKTIQPHHIRHMISGTVVFMLGIAANEVIVGGKVIGADPDANVRFQLGRDAGSENF